MKAFLLPVMKSQCSSESFLDLANFLAIERILGIWVVGLDSTEVLNDSCRFDGRIVAIVVVLERCPLSPRTCIVSKPFSSGEAFTIEEFEWKGSPRTVDVARMLSLRE